MAQSLHFTTDHEWIRVEGETGTIGISDYAQQQLGDVVFVELPEVDLVLSQGVQAAVVESVKAASEVYAPVSGVVVATNTALAENPGVVNSDCMGEGWFFQIRLTNPEELATLMEENDYAEYLRSLT